MLLSSIYPLGVYIEGGDAVLQYIPPRGIFSRGGGHTPAGGQVQISVHRQEVSTALIHVANDGEGIPPGQLGHIFERFYRGAPTVETTAGLVSA